MPVFKFSTKEAIPAELHDEVKEVDGQFEINLSATKKVDEFRAKNVSTSRERDELKAFKDQFGTILGEKKYDEWKAEYEGLVSTASKVKDGTLKASNEIEAEVTKRTESMRATLEGQIATQANETKSWREKAESFDAKYRTTLIDNAVNAMALDTKVGLNPKALPDVLARARAVFEVQPDGTLLPKVGGEIIRGDNGTDPMTVGEWLKNLRKTAEYYFLGSSGGGATGDSGEGSAKFGGMPQAEFNKLSPVERLKIANRTAAK